MCGVSSIYLQKIFFLRSIVTPESLLTSGTKGISAFLETFRLTGSTVRTDSRVRLSKVEDIQAI